jgi:hypothetical protein
MEVVSPCLFSRNLLALRHHTLLLLLLPLLVLL